MNKSPLRYAPPKPKDTGGGRGPRKTPTNVPLKKKK